MKKKKLECESCYLPGLQFKRRYLPPSKIIVEPGNWEETPLYLATTKDSRKRTMNLFNDTKEHKS
jgi:hypothetical protein